MDSMDIPRNFKRTALDLDQIYLDHRGPSASISNRKLNPNIDSQWDPNEGDFNDTKTIIWNDAAF